MEAKKSSKLMATVVSALFPLFLHQPLNFSFEIKKTAHTTILHVFRQKIVVKCHIFLRASSIH